MPTGATDGWSGLRAPVGRVQLAYFGLTGQLFAESVIVEGETLNLLSEEGSAATQLIVFRSDYPFGVCQLRFEVTDPLAKRLDPLAALGIADEWRAAAMKLGDDLGGAMGGGPTQASFSRQVGHGELSVAVLSVPCRESFQCSAQRFFGGWADAHDWPGSSRVTTVVISAMWRFRVSR